MELPHPKALKQKRKLGCKMRNRQTGRTMPSVTPLLPPLASPGHSAPMRPTLVQARGTNPCVPRMPPSAANPTLWLRSRKKVLCNTIAAPGRIAIAIALSNKKKTCPCPPPTPQTPLCRPLEAKTTAKKSKHPHPWPWTSDRPGTLASRVPCLALRPQHGQAQVTGAPVQCPPVCTRIHQPVDAVCRWPVPVRQGPSFVAGNWAGGGKLRSKLNTLGGHARGQGRACQTSAGPATEHQGTGASPKQKPGSRDRASSSQARPLRRGRRRHHHARRHRQPTTTFGRGAEAARTGGRPVARVTNGPVNLPIWKTPLSRRKQRGPAKHAGEPSRPGRASVAVFESPVPDPKHSPPSPGQGQPNGTPPPPPPPSLPPRHPCLRRSTLFLKGERHGPGDAPRTPPGFAERASFHRLTADMTGLLCLRLRPTRPSSESSCGRQPTDHFQTTRFSHEPLLVDGTDSTAHPLPESWFCPSRTTLDDFVWV